MSRRSAEWLASSTLALTVVFTALSLLLGPAGDATQFSGGIVPGLLLVMAAALGALLAARRPENPVGWFFCAAPFLRAVEVCARNYAASALAAAPGAQPGTVALAWLGAGWLGNPAPVLMSTLLLLTFPTGRLPSPRWRPVTWLAIVVAALYTADVALRPGPLGDHFPAVQNPVGLTGIAGIFYWLPRAVAPLWAALSVACAASLLLRFRRATGDERQQLKWVAYAVGSGLAWAALLWPLTTLARVARPAAFVLVELPVGVGLLVAIAVAVLRYRLYDIDLIIRRTLVYGALTAALAAIYFGGVVALQALFRGLTGQGSNVAIVTSTLAIAALFQPLRRRIQAAIDRRLYRRKYDAQRTLAAFAATLRDETDLEQLSMHLLAAVQETMQPEHVSLWLRPQTDGRVQLIAEPRRG